MDEYGEGGLSEHHLSGDVDLIFQIGPGLFGVRDKAGVFDIDAFLELAHRDKIRAFEIKLAQGAKTRGGHMQGNKVTEEMQIYVRLNHGKQLIRLTALIALTVQNLYLMGNSAQATSSKPVGFKIVVSKVSEVEKLVQTMVETNQYPSFITVDGGEGGTGATFQELQDGVGLPLFTACLL
ncbi:hypothetical protein GS926_10855 [Rhodococcus hoagii]|nr:hypothetical protein [Prescottella equi]